MSCSNSAISHEKEKPSGPETVSEPLTLQTVTWEKEETWAEYLQQDLRPDASSNLNPQFQVAYSWLAQKYPDCDRKGTIFPVGDPLQTSAGYGLCKYESQFFSTADSNNPAIMLSLTLVLALPLAENGEAKFEVGAALDSPEMEAAKKQLLEMMALVDLQLSSEHAELHIIIGADMLRCKYKSGYQKPTITPVPEPDFAKSTVNTDFVTRETHENPAALLPMSFSGAVVALLDMNPGCTVWDGGDFSFNVGNLPYALPARLLVVRRFENTADEVAATHYTVWTPDTTSLTTPVTIVRGSQPEQAFDGTVVHLRLLVAIPAAVVWPKTLDFANDMDPIMKSAMVTLLKYLKELNKLGKLHRCLVEVMMGTDCLQLSFVGDKIVPMASEINKTDPIAASKPFTSLDGFSITLKEEPRHLNFDSESHFQAIKQKVKEEASQDPDYFTSITPMLTQRKATDFLETNYPGCKISDEGEAPFTHKEKAVIFSNTRLLIATEPSKSKNNIVSVILNVPLPGGVEGGWAAATETNWTERMEMTESEKTLLAVLKQWYKEERIAEDCIAMVTIGTDVGIWRFVDGERFEDLDDEQVDQLKW